MDTLKSFSLFYYGFDVTTENIYLNFNEGAGERTAIVPVGSYTMTDMANAIENALNTYAFSRVFTVTVNRTTRVFTISADGNFSLLPVTGTQASESVLPSIGFTTDRSGASSYAANLPAGFEFEPQFRLQNYVPIEHWTGAALATVNKAATGRIEVIKFGSESFMQASIPYITDIAQISQNEVLKNNPTGVQDAVNFLIFAVTKAPLEFMPDIDDPSTFYEIILESTPDNKDGVGFKLMEMYDKALPGYYDTGILKFRQVEQ